MSAHVLSGLRRWAAGSATDMAAVELLALVADGRLLRASAPWVRHCVRPGWFWLDPAPLAQLPARLQNRDRQLVTLAVALLGETRSAGTRRTGISGLAA